MNRDKTPKLAQTLKNPKQKILGIHIGGHDCTFAVIKNGEVKEVIELERIYKEKRYRVFPESIRFDKVLQYIFEEYKLDRDFEAVAIHIGYFREELLDIAINKIKKYLPEADYLMLNHHLCHAASGYFTSPFTEASILSYDGWGNDGSTITFVAKGNQITYLNDWEFRLGTSYRALGSIIGGINEFDNHTAGKTMGLTAYGKAVDAWKKPIKRFIKTYLPIRDQVASWEPSVAENAFYLEGFGPVVGENTFDGPESREAQNFATTFQKCWTEVVLEIVEKTVDETKIRDFCIVGGAAMNAITNYELIKSQFIRRLHTIPNPSDTGLAMGAALYYYYAYQNMKWEGIKNKYLSPYLGVPIMDEKDLNSYVKKYKARKLENSEKDLAEYISKGNIVGVIQGKSEIGPRALGNRSILCDPRKADMKEILNNKVKGREWYRPFAPVVREEDELKYYNLDVPAPYMSIIAYVKDEWKDKIPAVTHVDGSARLQTVRREQNEFLWSLLGEFEALTGVGVLLNTSFNGKGEPIISTIDDALRILDTTEMDGVFCNGWLFDKSSKKSVKQNES